VITSLKNLKAGIKWWRDNRWEQDFLNADYYAIYEARSAGTTKEWWAATVNRLGQWRAYRGRTAPNTKSEIHSRGDERLGLIGAEFTKLACSGAEPSIADLSWEDAASFFAVVSEIKPRSPVFAGKMCHFTFPRLLIVMDNAATSVFDDYEFYWRGMKDEWSRFPEKADARNLFEEAINSASEKPLHPSYPFETKILELSHIGYNHG
jgi:hypothetical protein